MLTSKSMELLIDLVEIKLGSMEAVDSSDRKTLRDLEACRKELTAIMPRGATAPAPPGNLGSIDTHASQGV